MAWSWVGVGRVLVLLLGHGQQRGAQLAGALGGQAVEVDVLAAACGAGADPHGREPQQPLHEGGGEVDRAHPVELGGAAAPLEQSLAQLDPAVVDAVAGRDVAQHAEGHRHHDAEHLPGDAAAAHPAADEDQRDQRWQEPADLAHRVHEQHPRVQPQPEPAVGGLSSLGRRGHVASPSTASAFSVSSSTRARAVARSSALMLRAPAAEAVVTVTSARPKSRETGPSA